MSACFQVIRTTPVLPRDSCFIVYIFEHVYILISLFDISHFILKSEAERCIFETRH